MTQTLRRLAAVWFADIVGYSRLSSTDEDRALAQVELFQRLAREHIDARDGRLIKFVGDGALAEFASTEAAARAAIALRDVFARQADATLRVGLHVGEVAHADDGDIYGDGVNTACRLQEAAEPGEILASEGVWRQLRHRPAFTFGAEGTRALKGVAEPERVFALRAASALETPRPRRTPSRFRQRWVWFAAVTVIVIGGAWFVLDRGGSQPALLDEDLVAVLPFRVAGADPSLAYLREGMVDLLATKLAGSAGPRALDARTVISAWRRSAGDETAELTLADAIDVGRSVGAGQLLLGSAVGTPTRLVLTASLVGVSTGQIGADASVQGPADSLSVLVDRLATALLSLAAGEDDQRLAYLTSASLSAVRAYLAGQAAYRHGEYEQAADRFEEAIHTDSSFALAALGLRMVAEWTSSASSRQIRLAEQVAWLNRDRLNIRDVALLNVLVGANYPEPPTLASDFEAAQRLVELAPDRPEAWYELGDTYLHNGPVLGIGNHLALAAEAFRRSLALDPSFTAALEHLIDAEAGQNDSTAVRQFGALYLASNANAENAGYYQWRVAVATADSGAIRQLRTRFSTMTFPSLWRIIGWGQLTAAWTDDAELAASALASMPGSSDERTMYLTHLATFDWNSGRPRQAARRAAAASELGASSLRTHTAILAGLFQDGDASAADRAAIQLGALVERDAAPWTRPADICALEQWRGHRGNYDKLTPSLAVLRSDRVPATDRPMARICASLLAATHAVATHRPTAHAAVEYLDSLARDQMPFNAEYGYLPVAVARLYETLGEPERALAAVRRRFYDWGGWFLSTGLREEARLAALTGDRDGAVRALERYLELHQNAEREIAAHDQELRQTVMRRISRPGDPRL